MPDALDLDDLRGRVLQAVLTNDDGKVAEAVSRFETLHTQLESATDRRPEVRLQHARVLLGLSSSRLDVTGDVDASLAILAEAERHAALAEADHMKAAIQGQRALFLLRLGETDAALDAFDAGSEHLDAAEPYDQMTLLLNRSALFLELGRLPAARRDLERCIALATASGSSEFEQRARHNLGYAAFLEGHIPAALASMAEAARIAGDDRHPVGLLDQARVLREGGLVRDADAVLAEAAEILEDSQLFQDLGEVELARAESALVDDEPGRALTLARTAVRRFADRGNVRWQRKGELVVLEAERAKLEAASGGRDECGWDALARKAHELAQVCAVEGRTDLARRAALLAADAASCAGPRHVVDEPVARTPLRPGDSLSTRMRTRAVRARVALAAGDRSRGLREVRRGLAELGSYQSGFGSLDLRAASAVHGVALARLDLDLAVRSGRAGAVFASIERTRAVSSRLAGVRPPSDPETADLLSRLRQTEEELRGLEGEASAAEQRARLRTRTAELQRAVRARAWEQEGAAAKDGGRARTVRLGELSGLLDELGAGFVSYVVHERHWLAVVVTGRRATMVPLGDADGIEQLARRVRADLDALAMSRLPAPLRESVHSSLQLGLARLDELLVAPLAVAGVPLVLSPSGPLVTLPWSLLGSRRGLPVVVVPSASAWVRARSVPSASGRRQVTVVAGPGLRRAEDEAQRVHQSWRGSTLLTGGEATTAAVCKALTTADVVHVAAHGTHQQESPLFSSVRLTDGPLYAYELDPGAGMAGCVVLSACEAGLTTVRPGDEGLGLTSVLLHLGARSVVAGVGRVGDDVAADAMQRLHGHLARSADSATALAMALEECADAEQPVPFVCFGSGWQA